MVILRDCVSAYTASGTGKFKYQNYNMSENLITTRNKM